MERYFEVFGANLSAPDIRDYKFAKSEISNEFPESFELRMPPVKNQGQVSSCVAHSLATIVEYYEGLQDDPTGNPMSVGYIYGNRTLMRGKGMFMRAAMATLCAEGTVYHAEFPYNEEVPKILDMVEAAKPDLAPKALVHRPTAYIKVKSEKEIKTALMKGMPVTVSIKWYKFSIDKNGVMHRDTTSKPGLHCVTIYGWNKDGWKLQNSWGTYWGINGCAIYPYEYKFQESYAIADCFTADITTIQQPFAKCKWFTSIWNKLYTIYNIIKYNITF